MQRFIAVQPRDSAFPAMSFIKLGDEACAQKYRWIKQLVSQSASFPMIHATQWFVLYFAKYYVPKISVTIDKLVIQMCSPSKTPSNAFNYFFRYRRQEHARSIVAEGFLSVSTIEVHISLESLPYVNRALLTSSFFMLLQLAKNWFNFSEHLVLFLNDSSGDNNENNFKRIEDALKKLEKTHISPFTRLRTFKMLYNGREIYDLRSSGAESSEEQQDAG